MARREWAIEKLMAESSLSTLRISIADMISLNVRTRGSRNPLLPEVLYQSLPAKAMALMATMPYGPFAVSIPGESRSKWGFPILKDPVPSAEGFVILYSRQPNGRYEADEVEYQSRRLYVDEFVRLADQWIRQRAGDLKIKPGSYIYVAPSREEWNVILRDSGFTAWDPSRMPLDSIPVLLEKREAQYSSGVSVRIPVRVGERPPFVEGLPVFTQVEVSLDPDPDPQEAWMSFTDYRRIRELRTRPPESMRADFCDWLNLLTEESGFKYWIFDRGMLFGDCVEWWGDCARRRTKHEGIDFAKGFRTGSGICSIPEGVPVRSIADGEVTAILDDFMGKTVVVRHPSIARANGDVFHTLLSHIQPHTTKLSPVTKRQIIGEVRKGTAVRVQAHLHLTGAWFSKNLDPNEMTIDHIHPAFEPVALVNIEALIKDNPQCRRVSLEEI